jgi:hypothetical protein
MKRKTNKKGRTFKKGGADVKKNIGNLLRNIGNIIKRKKGEIGIVNNDSSSNIDSNSSSSNSSISSISSDSDRSIMSSQNNEIKTAEKLKNFASRIYSNIKDGVIKSKDYAKSVFTRNKTSNCPPSVVSQGMEKIYSLFGDVLRNFIEWRKMQNKKQRSVDVNAILYKSLTNPKDDDIRNIILEVNSQGFPIFESMNEVDDMLARIKIGKKIPREYAYTMKKRIIHNDKPEEEPTKEIQTNP